MQTRHSVVGFAWLLGLSVALSSCGRSTSDPPAAGGDANRVGGGGASGAGAAQATGGSLTGGGGAQGGAGRGGATDQGGSNAGGSSGSNAGGSSGSNAGGSSGSNAGGSDPGGAGGEAGGGEVCEHCQGLPNVKPGARVRCVDDKCILSSDACETGFAHCSGDATKVGCETDLSDPATCGSCSERCQGLTSVCLVPHYICSGCSEPHPIKCRNKCSNLTTDPDNCGACGVSCGTAGACLGGICYPCMDGLVNCARGTACRESLWTPEHCGECGRTCSFDSAAAMCTADARCAPTTCNEGFANCDAVADDCETALGTASGCEPAYLGHLEFGPAYMTGLEVASAPDGSYFVAGWFDNEWDLDPTLSANELQPLGGPIGEGEKRAFVSKFSANGTRAWLHLFNENVSSLQIASSSDGSLAVTRGVEHLVPDPSTPDTVSVEQELLLLKLSASGSAVWEHRFKGTSLASTARAAGVAVDAAGAVVLAMNLQGDFDLDPGTAVDAHRFELEQGYLAKFAASGARAWGQPIADEPCAATSERLTLGAGSIHVVGTAMESCELAGKPSFHTEFGPWRFLLTLTPQGVHERASWVSGIDAISGLTPHADGAVVLAGSFSDAIHVDSATNLLARSDGKSKGFVWRVAASHESEWFKVVAASVISTAATPDDGVIAVLHWSGPHLAALHGDGSPGWTSAELCEVTGPLVVAGNATHLLVAGLNRYECDLDLGPARVAPARDTRFVARYRY